MSAHLDLLYLDRWGRVSRWCMQLRLVHADIVDDVNFVEEEWFKDVQSTMNQHIFADKRRGSRW